MDKHSEWLPRLVPEVVEFSTPAFSLEVDLRNLQRVQGTDAYEATILYCVRILDALAVSAVERAGLSASPNGYSNLMALDAYNLLSTSTNYWAHALRRIGNDVRHIRRRINAMDAELAPVFLERWLVWFFCLYRFGHRLPSLTHNQAVLQMTREEELQRITAMIDDANFDPRAVVDYVCNQVRSIFLKSPSLPAVVADVLMERQFYAEAGQVLEMGLEHFPEDLRLCQLRGLYFSRTGNLDRALAWLDPLYARFRDDDETTGIMAGVYKRKWLLNRESPKWLEKSHRAYAYGWKRSRHANAYLGMNEATTALWLDRLTESRAVARDVEGLLRKRLATLESQGHDEFNLNYWDWVTLAEAELLQGKLWRAWQTYSDAFAAYPQQRDTIEISLEQSKHILETMGLSHSFERFAGPPPIREQTPPAIGVTGHRVLPADEALVARIDEALARIECTLPAGVAPVLLSPLAEGADRLVADRVLARWREAALEVVLPLELAEYSRDFSGAESFDEFQRLLNYAAEIVFPDGDLERSGAMSPISSQTLQKRAEGRMANYEWCGRYVTDHCDVLVVLWDGAPARGRGGTAEIVDYARQLCRPLVWIRTEAPYELVCEGL